MMNETEAVTVKDIAGALGTTVRFINMRATKEKENWPHEKVNGRGDKRFYIDRLPPDVQKALAESGKISMSTLPFLAPEAALALVDSIEVKTEGSLRLRGAPARLDDNGGFGNRDLRLGDTWADETAIDISVVRNNRVRALVPIIQEAQRMPANWDKGRRKWIELVAVKHDVSFQTIYRWLKDYEKKGLAGLRHTKSTRRQAKVWSPEAMDWWIGICLKKEHRRVDKKDLYKILLVEADKRGWNVGGYSSALWWYNRKVSPQLLALQRGGFRALDNTLPPILRDYSDLEPFQILVGDQHRFDFWVVDEETGEVFRPEGYFWQDLRTRCFYGGAVDRKYDAYLMGLALRMGLKIFGTFDQIYTDWGKPEHSRYIMSILKDMRAVGLGIGRTVDWAHDQDISDGETVNPWMIVPGSHRKVIVRNAKAKMMESTFSMVERILRSVFRVPGHVKDLGGLKEENDVDQAEIERLAASGKLLTYWEFVGFVFKALDYYNKEKHHRGVRKEWLWQPKPSKTSPLDCLKACYLAGWKPVRLPDNEADIIFLPRATRGVDRGRILFRNERYEHDKLIPVPAGERLEIRYDPMDPETILVFRGGEFLCVAGRVEYSSMRNQDLASRKIEEKARRRKGFILEYRRLTSSVPDFMVYSSVPVLAKAAALMSKDKRKRAKALAQITAPMSDQELASEMSRIEAEAERIEKYDPKRMRPIFRNEVERYEWCVTCIGTGAALGPEDDAFMREYEAGMDDGTREYWDIYKNTMDSGLRRNDGQG